MKSRFFSFLIALAVALILNSPVQAADEVCMLCKGAKADLLEYVQEVDSALQAAESGDVIGYKLLTGSCQELELHMFIGYDFGPDGCAGVSEDQEEALDYLHKVQEIVNDQGLNSQYSVEVKGCGIGQPNPGDAQYFHDCQLGGHIPHSHWLVRCDLQRSCTKLSKVEDLIVDLPVFKYAQLPDSKQRLPEYRFSFAFKNRSKRAGKGLRYHLRVDGRKRASGQFDIGAQRSFKDSQRLTLTPGVHRVSLELKGNRQTKVSPLKKTLRIRVKPDQDGSRKTR